MFNIPLDWPLHLPKQGNGSTIILRLQVGLGAISLPYIHVPGGKPPLTYYVTLSA